MSKKKFIITVDLEQDISSYLKESYTGIQYGIPPFLNLLDELKIKIDFFTTADVCQRYPNILKKIVENGHTIGSHGLSHEMLWFKRYKSQLDELSISAKLIDRHTGIKPTMFRAPAFSATEKTLKALEKLNYSLDSSVMPGAVIKRYKGMVTIKSFKNAPRVPYHPSPSDITKEGNMNIIEFPLTENPIFPGAPLGAGALNFFGLEKTLSAAEMAKGNYTIFLIHPWELVNLGEYYPTLKQGVKDICSDDLQKFKHFFTEINKKFEFSTISEVYNSII